MLGIDLLRPGVRRPEARFPQNVGYVAELGGEFFLVVRTPGRILEHLGCTLPAEVKQALALAVVRDEPDEVPGVFIAGVHRHIVVRLYPEELLEIVIVLLQQIIDHRFADEDHFEIQGDRLGAQRFDRHQAELLLPLLDAQLPAAQRTLERIPAVDVSKDVLNREYQKAAVCLQQRTRLDQGEVGVQRPHLHLFFDATDEVVVVWVELHDHRGAGAPAVVHDDVHIVFLEELLPHRLDLALHLRVHLALLFLLPRRLLEGFDIVEDVLLHLVEVRADRLVPFVLLPKVLERPLYAVLHDLAVELVHLFACLPVEAAVVFLEVADLLLELLSLPLDLLALLLRQLLEILIAQRLPVFDRDRRRTHDGRLQHEALFLRRFLNLARDFLAALLHIAERLFAMPAVLLTLEDTRNIALYDLPQMLHVGLELVSLARGQSDCARLIGILQIVDEAPIARCVPLRGNPLEIRLHRCHLPDPRRTGNVDIVSLPVHLKTELKGLQGPILADDLTDPVRVPCRLDTQVGGVNVAPCLLCRQFHVKCLPYCNSERTACRLRSLRWSCPSSAYIASIRSLCASTTLNRTIFMLELIILFSSVN